MSGYRVLRRSFTIKPITHGLAVSYGNLTYGSFWQPINLTANKTYGYIVIQLQITEQFDEIIYLTTESNFLDRHW